MLVDKIAICILFIMAFAILLLCIALILRKSFFEASVMGIICTIVILNAVVYLCRTLEENTDKPPVQSAVMIHSSKEPESLTTKCKEHQDCTLTIIQNVN